ncbi:MAG: LytR C-terminal domain-containing protein [Candidatus Kapaibacterium sp.]
MNARRIVNISLLVLLSVLVAAFSYALVYRFLIRPPVEAVNGSIVTSNGIERAIQLQILNATDVPGIAKKATEYLRSRGFDVVQVTNAPIRSVGSFVVRVTTDSASSARVAYALGIEPRFIRFEVDSSLMLDCTVVLGNDYTSLRPFR